MVKSKVTKEDREWTAKIKEKYPECIICSKVKFLNAHHLIPKQIKKFRHDVRNGISLCPSHHRFSFELSAHQNPIAFIAYLSKNHEKVLDDLSLMMEEECKN